MRKCIVAGAVLALMVAVVPNPVSGETTTYTIVGGPATCKGWSKERKAARKSKAEFGFGFESVASEFWILGYVSGLAASLSGPQDVLKSVNGKLVIDWVDQFCEKKPEKDAADALVELMEKLQKLRRGVPEK